MKKTAKGGKTKAAPKTKTATEKVKAAADTTGPEPLPEKDEDIEGGEVEGVDDGDDLLDDDDDDDEDDDDDDDDEDDANDAIRDRLDVDVADDDDGGAQAELNKGFQAEEKKPLILHAKDFHKSVYVGDTEEYDGSEGDDADLVIVANKEETSAYFVKILDKDRATRHGAGLNQRYTFNEATALAKKILNS